MRHLPGWLQDEARSVLGQGGCALRPQLAGDLEPPCDLPAEVPLPNLTIGIPEMGRVESVEYVPTGLQPSVIAEIEAAVNAEVKLSQWRAEEGVATAGADPRDRLYDIIAGIEPAHGGSSAA